MSHHYEHVLSFALEHPWNLTPTMLNVVANVLARRLASSETPRADIEAALVQRKNLPQPRVGSVSVIPIYGVLAPRMNMMSEMSGGTSYSKISAQLRAAVDDKAVRNIVLDIDSPGGSVAGNAELASEIMRARTRKPIIAVAQYTAASAAYQIAAAATEIVAAPSAQVGSIGTYAMHNDLSEALKMLGVKRTYIFAGEGKVDGNEAEPLSETAVTRWTALIDSAYGMFVNNVVRGRGGDMTPEIVRNDWKAHVYTATEAKSLGMIDSIATLDETLMRLLTASPEESDKRAAAHLSAARDTGQEPSPATPQDRRADAALEAQAFEAQFATVR
jgi:signal peptide peptidase SppA